MSRKRSFAVLSVVVVLAGCYGYRSAPLASIEPKNQVRVTSRAGQRTELVGVTASGDSLRGVSARQRLFRVSRDQVAMPVADIALVRVRRLDVRRSVAAGVGMAALVALPVLLVIQLGKTDFDPLGGMHW
jgi:hypothetical protein